MTTYTPTHSLPILESTDKIAASDDGLRQDINALALAAASAITAEGGRAEAAAKAYADLGLLERGDLPDNQDMNLMTDTGIYKIPSQATADTLTNIGVKAAGAVAILGDTGPRAQLQFPNTGGMLVRSINTSTGVWPSTWDQLDLRGRKLPLNTDVRQFRAVGEWWITTTPDALTMSGLPAKIPGTLRNIPTSTAEASIALYHGTGANRGMWYSTITGGTPGAYTWSDWQPLHWVRDYGAGHQVNVQRERTALGGPIGTGGKAVAFIRIDHNNTKFQSIVLPMLRGTAAAPRDLPASMCHFVNEFTPDPGYTNDTSTGHSWADVQAAALLDGIEVFNHGWSHQEVTTQAEYEKEILDSRAELEAQMPKIRVKGFMVPGVNGNNWGNFSNNLANLDVFRTTEPGRLIMHSHASCNGGGSTLWPVGTGSTLGWASRQIDTDTVASTQINIIKSAQAQGGMVGIMLHPNMVDNGAGFITSAVLAEIFDYLVAERDAGRLEVLTVTGALNADTERTTRNNLVRDPKMTNTAAYWVGTAGWSVAAGVATGTAAAGMMGTNVNLSGTSGWAKGSARQLAARFKGNPGDVVKVRAYDLANAAVFDVSREFTLTDTNWKTVRRNLHIPTTGTNDLRLEFGRVSGGAGIQWETPRLEAI